MVALPVLLMWVWNMCSPASNAPCGGRVRSGHALAVSPAGRSLIRAVPAPLPYPPLRAVPTDNSVLDSLVSPRPCCRPAGVVHTKTGRNPGVTQRMDRCAPRSPLHRSGSRYHVSKTSPARASIVSSGAARTDVVCARHAEHLFACVNPVRQL